MTSSPSSTDQFDLATPDTSMEDQNTTSRRKSGRAVQAPVLLSKDPSLVENNGNIGKRKRTQLRGGDAPDASDEEDDEESDQDESDPDEEELKEKRRKAAKKATPKPAPKRSRTADPATTKLAVRPATNGTSKPAKPRKPKTRQAGPLVGDGTGLYGKWARALQFLPLC